MADERHGFPRLSTGEMAGLALLLASMVDAGLRHRAAALAAGAQKARRQTQAAIDEPGAGIALLGAILLNRRRPRR